MESIQLFTALVMAVAALHLATTAGRKIIEWWDAALRQMELPERTAYNVVALTPGGALQPDDWYVFFHCSAFTVSADAARQAAGDRQKKQETQQAGQLQRPRIAIRL